MGKKQEEDRQRAIRAVSERRESGEHLRIARVFASMVFQVAAAISGRGHPSGFANTRVDRRAVRSARRARSRRSSTWCA